MKVFSVSECQAAAIQVHQNQSPVLYILIWQAILAWHFGQHTALVINICHWNFMKVIVSVIIPLNWTIWGIKKKVQKSFSVTNKIYRGASAQYLIVLTVTV